MDADDVARLSPYWREHLAAAPRLSVWPPLLSAQHAQLVSGLLHLEASQWLPAGELRRHQLSQAEALLRYAEHHCPHYHEAFAAAGFDPRRPLTDDAWLRVPILTRRDIQTAGRALQSRRVPPLHGALVWTNTSGAVGEPVHVAGTEVTRLYHTLLTLRDHEWHARDLGGKLAAIRVTFGKAPAPDGVMAPTWGTGFDGVLRTGAFGLLDIDTDIAVQARWLARFDPDCLLTYPTNAAALIDYTSRHRVALPRLKVVRAVGEVVFPELRQACRETWNAEVIDMYSSNEAGYIALQCPRHQHLHVQSESVMVEVLRDSGVPCAPGEVGRVVVTPLHNLAMPLIRYDIGDLAEAGSACDCGRGLPVLTRVIGRIRHMLTLPSGERRWPLLGYALYRDVAPQIRQYQIIQESFTDVLARFVVDSPLSAEQEARLAEILRGALHHPFRVRFEYPASIPREKGGKFFIFVNRATATTPR